MPRTDTFIKRVVSTNFEAKHNPIAYFVTQQRRSPLFIGPAGISTQPNGGWDLMVINDKGGARYIVDLGMRFSCSRWYWLAHGKACISQQGKDLKAVFNGPCAGVVELSHGPDDYRRYLNHVANMGRADVDRDEYSRALRAFDNALGIQSTTAIATQLLWSIFALRICGNANPNEQDLKAQVLTLRDALKMELDFMGEEAPPELELAADAMTEDEFSSLKASLIGLQVVASQ